MVATKFLDAIARLPDCDGEDSDPLSAYTQVKLDEIRQILGKGHEFVDAWVSLPRSKIPNQIQHLDKPVCPLRRKLYGHEMAGFLWQKYAEDIVINTLHREKLLSWDCLYVHREKKLFLLVHVDDLKMAGKKENIKPMWAEVKTFMDLEDPRKMVDNQFLGCAQQQIIPAEEDVERIGAAFENFAAKPGDPSARVTHQDLRKGDVDVSETDVKVLDEKESGSVELDLNYSRDGETSCGNTEVTKHVTVRNNSIGKTVSKHQVRGYAYDMQGHTEGSVQKYLEFSGKHKSSLQPVATPCLDDHMLDPEDDQKKGVLKEESAKIVLTALYVARYNQLDLLWSVSVLAREVTKWTVNCDKRLHRLVCYMHFASHLEMQCSVGDRPEVIQLALFVGASFASWRGDSKSTSGAVLALMGSNTFVPISWFWKRKDLYRIRPQNRS